MRLTDYHLGLLLVTGSAIAWSTAGYFTHAIALDTPTMLAWRGIFGAIGLAAVLAFTQGPRALTGFVTLGWQGWLYAVVSGAGMVFFITALRNTTVAHVAVIYAAVPFVAAALAWIVLRERPSRSAIWVSLVALIGVIVMVGLGREGSLLGDLLAFGMTVGMAVMMVMARRYPGIPVLQAACLSALLSGLLAWPFGTPTMISGTEFGLLAAFGLVNSALGLTLFTVGARKLPAIETGLVGALDAPLAPLWVWLAFGEVPGKTTLIGGTIVFAAVAAHIVLSSRPAATDSVGDRR